MDTSNLIELARQLREPSGDYGLEIAEMMHESNYKMTMASIDSLNIQSNEKILEIGHGNCSHLKDIISKVSNLHYTGLDISELMNKTASKINSNFIENGVATFTLYDGEIIPFNDNSFDKIFTVNTIYFWNNPKEFLKEIYRVLNSNGILSIAFGRKEYMEKLPFTQYGFQLYDKNLVMELIIDSGFKHLESLDYNDQIISKNGSPIERFYTVSTLIK